jgi:DNA-directed RNA polymerase specialized sigma24 family protein
MLRTIVFHPGSMDLESNKGVVVVMMPREWGLTDDQLFVLDVGICFDTLGEKEAACLCLLYGDGETLRGTAKELKMGPETVKWWRDKGLSQLGELLEQKHIDLSNRQWLRYMA